MADLSPLLLAVLLLCASCVAAAPEGQGRADHPADMEYLDNGVIRVGVDLNVGGAITYLSPSPRAGAENNVINSWDWGRQVQMSYYSGPVPFIVGDKHPAEQWKGLGWNPIQAGDDYEHGSKTVAHTNDGKTLYVKCVPMQWPLDNVPGECTFESWLTLDGPVVNARCRLNNERSDLTQYPGRTQELPAVYTNGPLYRLMTYTGDKPYTGASLTRIEKKAGEPGPWSGWLATEHWAALVNDDNWGVGVYNGGCSHFSGGFAGKPGAGGPHDSPTGYIAPNRTEILDHDIRHEFSYALILGSLDEIRIRACQFAPRPGAPAWRFEQNRQGWHFVHATDTGWPIKGELNVLVEQDDPQLIGPAGFWQADMAPTLRIEAAFHTSQTKAQVFWQTHAEQNFSQDKSVSFDINPDGDYHVYDVGLAASARYRGAIVQLRLDPVASGHKGASVRIRSIEFPKVPSSKP